MTAAAKKLTAEVLVSLKLEFVLRMKINQYEQWKGLTDFGDSDHFKPVCEKAGGFSFQEFQ
jgi:hypothetical protein